MDRATAIREAFADVLEPEEDQRVRPWTIDVNMRNAWRPVPSTCGPPPFSSDSEEHMAQMVKVIEVLAQSETSWDDAAKVALAEASKTVKGIRSIYVKDMQAIVDDDRIVAYRITAKISFVLDEDR